MNCTIDVQAIATKEAYCYLETQADRIAPEPNPVHVPQRKARLSDRTRVRRHDVQGWVFHCTGARTTAQISAALKKLGKKLDLRLTAAWMEINLNLADVIAEVIMSERALGLVGKKVRLREYSARLAYLEAWSPFQVLAVGDGMAKLELLSFPVAIADLVA